MSYACRAERNNVIQLFLKIKNVWILKNLNDNTF